MKGDAAALNLTSENKPEPTFYPDMVEGDLRLSHVTYASSTAAVDRSTTTNTIESSVSSTNETVVSSNEDGNNDSSGVDGERGGAGLYTGGQAGVVWSVDVPQKSGAGATMMNWTICASTGLLPRGKRCVRRDTVRHG